MQPRAIGFYTQNLDICRTSEFGNASGGIPLENFDIFSDLSAIAFGKLYMIACRSVAYPKVHLVSGIKVIRSGNQSYIACF